MGVGSTLAALGSGFANVGRSMFGFEQQRRQNEANMKLAEYGYSKDLEMWNRGNVYNAPQAQMERLKAAGLNPNLVYGSGSPAGQSAGSLPKYNAPTVDYSYQPPILDMATQINQFQDFRIKNAQVSNMETQGELLGQKEMMGRTDVDYYPDIAFLKSQILRNKEGAGSWSNFDGIPDERTRFGESQREFLMGKRRTQELEQERLIQATRNLDLQNDYFAAKAITGLFGGAVGALGKGVAMFRGGKGALAPGTLQNAKKWEQFEKAQKRYK